ncbi:protein of unknown function [Haloarcula vallismortis]|uniref:DUF4330 domain-containing protein n=2 Tax=Haloarcula vallismortis TaxID=28442 RepID=M0IWY1_HALVA|nr:DUF4330 family protein [Haloarcula vallismortis]EMA01367.1 hypothetical protein C437_16751 [Haloarcula vallismortis ATCC 29715]SDX01731.1 protein of unknown function [Haloarcula vallismortis]
MADSRSSSLLDEDGNLFGLVNIVDALAVLLVIAVVVAGAALVLQPEPEPPAPNTTNVTLDLGTQPGYIVTEIAEGDTYSPNGDSELTVTDVQLTPQGNQTRVILRATLRGPPSDDSLTYSNAPPRLGRSLSIATSRYEVSGQIRAVGGDNSLAQEDTTVVLRDTMTAAEARDVTAGDEIRLAGRTVATVEDVAAYATYNSTEQTVFVEAELNTYRQQSDRRFGGTQVRRGQTVTLPAEDYTFNGRIEQIDSGLQLTTTDVLLEATVDAETADRIAAGDVTTVAGYEAAEVKTVTTYATQNPDRKRVLVGLSLATLEDNGQQRFGNAVVQRGNNITISTESYELSGAIRRVGALEPRGALANRTVTLRMTDVRADMADAIRPGMTETSGGDTIARITRVSTEPSVIITTGDNGSVNVADHPYLRDITITTELRVRETMDGVQFKREPLQQGSAVVINLGTITIEATVVSVGL